MNASGPLPGNRMRGRTVVPPARRRALRALIAASCVTVVGHTRASDSVALHSALEWRAGYAAPESRWGLGGDDSLYDVTASLRPMATEQSGAFKFHTELELTAASGDVVERSRLAALVPARADTDVFDLSRVWSSGSRHRDEARIDRFSVTWSPSWGAVTIGRHAVTWGGGLVFNPFDLFNPFAPGDVIRDYKIGADMVHVDVPLSDGGLQLLAVGRRDPVSGRVAARASSLAAQWQRHVDWGEWVVMGAWHYDEPVLGLGVAGWWREAAWRVDGTWVRVKPSGLDRTADYVSAVANIQYSWVWGGRNVLGFLEYHHNTLGGTSAITALQDPFLATQIARQNVFLLGSDYAAASLQVELHPLVNALVSAIVNVRDGSELLQPRLVWSATERMQVLGGFDIPLGRRGSEFGGLEVGDGLGTTRAPLSAYVRATWDW